MISLAKVPLADLLAEVHRRESGEIKSFYREERYDQIKKYSVKGYSVKDVVIEWCYENEKKKEDPTFQFFFRKKGQKKLQDFYYGNHPVDYEDWGTFIPPGFGERMENCYEYDGTLEEALKVLKKCGYTEVNKVECSYL